MNTTRFSYSYFLFVIVLVISGCGGGGGGSSSNNNNNGSTVTSPLISTIVFSDAQLSACITQTANSKNWSRINQVIELFCNDMGIISLGGIEQLTALITLDLTNNTIADISPLATLTGYRSFTFLVTKLTTSMHKLK